MNEQNSSGTASVVHPHNLRTHTAPPEARFGLRMRLPAGDTFGEILGEQWEKTHWFSSEDAREAAMRELRKQHPYYRLGDRPTLILEKINRSTTEDQSRPLR